MWNEMFDCSFMGTTSWFRYPLMKRNSSKASCSGIRWKVHGEVPFGWLHLDGNFVLQPFDQVGSRIWHSRVAGLHEARCNGAYCDRAMVRVDLQHIVMPRVFFHGTTLENSTCALAPQVLGNVAWHHHSFGRALPDLLKKQPRWDFRVTSSTSDSSTSASMRFGEGGRERADEEAPQPFPRC